MLGLAAKYGLSDVREGLSTIRDTVWPCFVQSLVVVFLLLLLLLLLLFLLFTIRFILLFLCVYCRYVSVCCTLRIFNRIVIVST